MTILTELKQRVLKFETLHGLYKIPLGGVLIWVAKSDIPYFGAMLEIQYSIHDIALFIGLKSLVEGLHDLCHNPIKKEVVKAIECEKYIANSLQK